MIRFFFHYLKRGWPLAASIRMARVRIAASRKLHRSLTMTNVVPLTTSPTIAQLAAEWLEAKAAEQIAVERRRALDVLIAERFTLPAEGTESVTEGGLKIAVTTKLTRTLDADAIKAHWDDLPKLAQDAVRWKPDLDLKVYRAAQVANPEAFAAIASHVTTKAAAPAVKVEMAKEAA